MSEATKQRVDTSSEEFKAGVEAGLKYADDTKNGAGIEFDPELKVKAETKEPLFVSDSPEGSKGDAQDEKDEAPE